MVTLAICPAITFAIASNRGAQGGTRTHGLHLVEVMA